MLKTHDYAVVIGGANLDIAGFSQAKLIAADSNPGKIQISAGGVGRNIARNLVSLGIPTKLITAVGNDVFGNLILDDCRQYGIDTSLINPLDTTSSSVYLAILDETGEMAVAVSDMKIMESLTIEKVKPLDKLIHDAAAIVADTNLRLDLLGFLAERYPKRIILDTVSVTKTTKVIDIIGSFQLIKPNRQEAEILTGFHIVTTEDAEKAITILLSKGIQTVVITMGKKGVVYGTAEGINWLTTTDQSSKNATGAGDALLATLVYGSIHGIDLHKTVKLAMIASAITIESEASASLELTEESLLNKFNQLNP